MYLAVADHESPDDGDELPPHYFADWRERQSVFEDLAGYYQGTVNLSGDDRPERYAGAFVSANFFDVLRQPPLMGRAFLPEEDRFGAPLVMIIGADIWRNRFNEDPGIVGKAVRVNGQDAEIVGVMPDGFNFPFDEDIWLPQQQDLASLARPDGADSVVFGRLRDGVTMEQARAAMQTLHDGLLADFPDERMEPLVIVKHYADEAISEVARRVIPVLFTCAAFVLLIACANVANLTLARVAGRRREIAIRASLGAARPRLIAGILLEIALVSMGGVALGLVFAHWGTAEIERVMTAADDLPVYWVDSSIDLTVAGFAFALALVTALVAGLLPALRASRADLNSGLRDGGYGASDARQGRVSQLLVTFQIALCCVLLICSGLMLRSAMNISGVEDGLGHRNAITGRIGLFETTFPEPADRLAAYEELQRELAALPGVLNATVTTGLPMAGTGATYYVAEGREIPPDARPPFAFYVSALPNFFDAFGIPMLQGRAFDSGDTADSLPAVIVNATFAAREWPGEDPLGKRIRLGQTDEGRLLTVVGVVSDFMQDDDDFEFGIRPAMYVPLAQDTTRFASFAATTDRDVLMLQAGVREAMLRVDPDTPIYWLRTLDEVSAIATFTTRFLAQLFGIIAAIAVLLATAGVYAVLAYAVGQRTREIGVRRALGASDDSILRMVAGRGARQFLVGIVVGLAVAAGFARLIQSLLVGVGAFDSVTFAGVVVMLGALSVVAAWIPAKRALRVQPITALHQD